MPSGLARVGCTPSAAVSRSTEATSKVWPGPATSLSLTTRVMGVLGGVVPISGLATGSATVVSPAGLPGPVTVTVRLAVLVACPTLSLTQYWIVQRPVKLGSGSNVTVPAGLAVNVPSPGTVRVAFIDGVDGSRSMDAKLRPDAPGAKLSLASTSTVTSAPLRVAAPSLPASGGTDDPIALASTVMVAEFDAFSVPSLAE